MLSTELNAEILWDFNIRCFQAHSYSETLFSLFLILTKCYRYSPDFRLVKYYPNCGVSGEDGGEILRWYFLMLGFS